MTENLKYNVLKMSPSFTFFSHLVKFVLKKHDY